MPSPAESPLRLVSDRTLPNAAAGSAGVLFSAEAEVDRIREALFRAVRRICPQWVRDQSEDLVQECLVRLVEVQNRSTEIREFSASYLWRVAYSALIDEIRKRRTRREVPLETDAESSAPTPRPTPERKTANRQLGQAILDCVAGLIDTRRRAVTLYLRGHSAQRMTELMGWKLRQAENLVLRGRQDLRQCLAGKGWEP